MVTYRDENVRGCSLSHRIEEEATGETWAVHTDICITDMIQSSLQYAVYTDRPGSDTPATEPEDYEFAGTVSIINASADDLTAEPGWIVIFPPYQVSVQHVQFARQVLTPQRTHVLTHAAGAVIHHILDSPEQGGLGLRRCQWFTTSLNLASQNAALRLGFTLEGVIRYHRVLPEGKEGARGTSNPTGISERVGQGCR